MPFESHSERSPSRRRQRTLSSSVASRSSPKRYRFEDKESVAMASAKIKGKLPETIDLTSASTASPASAFKPYSGAKKLVIKNLRTSAPDRETLAQQYYARTQQEQEDALEAVFAGRKPAVPLERLYRGVEDLCRKGYGETIQRTLKHKVDTHLQQTVLGRIRTDGGSRDSDILKSVLAEWKIWNAQTVTMRSTFSYFNQTYLLHEGLPTLNDTAIAQFRKMLFSSSHGPGPRVIAGILELIDIDRRGSADADTSTLKEAIMMLYVLGVYVRHFEGECVKHSSQYYEQYGEARAAASLKDYIQAVQTLLQREHRRCMEFNLDRTTEKQLTDAAHVILIEKYSDKLLNSGSLATLLSENEVEPMKGLYDLLRLSQIVQKLKEPWKAYILSAGASIIGDKSKGDEMVLRLLLLRRALDVMIRDAFYGDEQFLYDMRNSFAGFMNDRAVAACWNTGTSKVGEMTAKHIDALLRGGLKTLPSELLSDVKDRANAEKEGQASTGDEDAELDRQLDSALELFRFIEGKDTFEAFYKRDLARRLLLSRSASHDAERNMLTKLRGECGASFTQNLEQMFKDEELGRDEMLTYNQSGDNADRKPAVDISVKVLSAAAWPTYPDTVLNLPDEVATELERWENYYRAKHTGRTIKWKHSLAHCSVMAKFPKGRKELLVSAFQAVVLMLFNDVEADGALSYSQISAATGLLEGDLERTLQSLACGKARVLAKHPKGRDVNKSDTFTFNKAFSDLKTRVKINQIQAKETKEENQATQERIAQDRKFETQAAIVRIMKSRKTMGHAELVAEVITMTKKRGSVEPSAIKKEIETLIEKDYLEREGNSYTYQA